MTDSTSKDRVSVPILSINGSYLIDKNEHPVAHVINAGLWAWAVCTWAGPVALTSGCYNCGEKHFLVGAGFTMLGVLLLPLVPLGVVGYVPYSCFKLGWYLYKGGDVVTAGKGDK